MDAIINLSQWARRQPLLYRLTLGIRILLSLAFIPTGMVKVLGQRFTSIAVDEGDVGLFFETLYQSGIYWRFLGIAQVLAGIFVLWRRTYPLGAIFFLAITLNIFFITLSYDFAGTSLVTGAMTLASLWLIFWDWDKIRYLIADSPGVTASKVDISLSGKTERLIYVFGFVFGLILLSVMRGLRIPAVMTYIALGTSILCLLLAVGFAIRYRR